MRMRIYGFGRSYNEYCPTGPGGGKDPHCSPKGSKGGSSTSAGMVATVRDAEGKLSLADGSPLPKHLEKVRIPPAWTDVEVSLDPNADLLVRGKDAKGRRQPVYSESHNTRQAAKKYARTKELLEKREEIRAENLRNLNSPNKKISEPAAVLALIDATGMRPGGTGDTGGEKQAYGATTLKGKHVVETTKGVRLSYTGKKGVERTVDIDDPKLSEMLLKRSKAAGADGDLFDVNDDQLRQYTQKLDGGGFNPKNFRTAVGTAAAIEIVKTMPQPKTKKEYQKQVRQVGDLVSQKLGNTRDVAIQSYIDPTVFSGWRVDE